ncbi:MAG: MFS transporter [Hyphomicrobiaceae bacterium]|nr:MFS transporter [Hyphomicrobiaceae bacterium]
MPAAVATYGTGKGAASPAVPKGAWAITALLFFYMLVNFADKIVVGLAGVPIARDLGLSPKEFGFLGSSFFFLFSISAIAVGFLINKVETRWVLLALSLVWALVQFPMLFDVGFTTLVVCRIILGAGEGPAFAVAVHALFKWFPDERRTLPTAVISQGSAFGVIIAVPCLNWIIVNHSWHWAFGALGLVGLVWAAVWLIVGREGPLMDAPVDRPAGAASRMPDVSYGRLLSAPTFLGCCVATFGAYWALSLGLTWFTPFLINGLGFAQKDVGLISVLPWVAGASVVLLTGWVSQVAMAHGASSRLSRGVLGSAPLVLGGLVLLLLPYVESAAGRIALLVIGTGLSGSIYVVCPAMLGEFTPVRQRGAIIAIYGAIYTLAGIVAPLLTGSVIEGAATPLAGYLSGFRILAGILIASGLMGLLLLWPNRERARMLRA